MRLKLTTFFIVLTSLIYAQDAYHTGLLNQLNTQYGLTGGNWVLTSDENTNISNAVKYGFTFSQATTTGQDFTQVANMNISGAGANPWDAGYFAENSNTVQNGDRVLLVLWLRTTATNLGAPGQLAIFAEDGVTYHKEVQLTANPTTAWQRYLIPFESSDTYAAGDLHIGFHLAYQQQTIEMGGMTLINYGTSVPLSSLPEQLNIGNYPGSEPDAPWRAAAANRIEMHRKANMQLQIQDGQGNAIPNASVRIEMCRHEYAFGSAVVPKFLGNNPEANATYMNKILDLDGNGHGFNWVVNENALKWRAWEQGWAGSPSEIVTGIQWLRDNQIRVRGHVLLWPGWNFMPDDMQSNQNNPSYMLNRIDGRLNNMLNQWGVKGNIKEWDVINEIVHVRDLENALKGTTGYTTGRELYPDVFNKVKQIEPNIVSYINDYNILSNGSTAGGDYQLYKSMIQEILDAGGQVDGIGFQAHMGSATIAPDSLYAVIDDCYQTFGKDIKITEFDQSDLLPDTMQAKYLGDFLTMVYSHPATNGFLMWGFWDNAHWLDNAPLYYGNWIPKPAHATFTDLLFNQWWTDSTLTTNANGEVSLRGFKGDYKITATVNGTDLIAEVVMHDDVNTTINMFPVSLDKVLEGKVNVYPNPTHHLFNVEMPYVEDWNVTVFNEIGQTILQRNFTGMKNVIDVSHLNNGVYMMRIENPNGAKVMKKVVIMK